MASQVSLQVGVHWALEAFDPSGGAAGDVLLPSVCGGCSSYQQIAAHRAARHGFRNLASFYAGGTCCVACAWELHRSKAMFEHLNYVRTGCLCTWACFSLPCAMPVAVRHAGRGADSLLISNSGFVVPLMRMFEPLLCAGDLQKPCR